MKAFFILTLISFVFARTEAQRLPFTSSVKNDLKVVVQSFPENFSSIRGEPILSDPGTTQYESRLQLKGALANKIIAYAASPQPMWAFESKLMATENFTQFRNAYRSIYSDIKSAGLFSKSGLQYEPESDYVSPTEGLRQINNLFKLKDPAASNGNLYIDISGEYINFEWVIYLRVYEKQPQTML